MSLDHNLLSDLLIQTETMHQSVMTKRGLMLNSLDNHIFNKESKTCPIDYSILGNSYKKVKVDELEDIFLGFQKIKEEEAFLSQERSIRFNVLNFFHIDETLHSRLLGFFLNDRASHGQGDLFLRKFVEKLGYTDYKTGKWKVTIEKQKIDILIERKNPFSAVIIENKSNGANDQENQIYRYWHKVIYSKSREKINENSNFKIIYLVSDDGKIPSENTLAKPVNFSKDLPEKVPVNVEIWNFNNQIQEWLNECLFLVSDENHRLKEYIKQYIEYWN